MNEWIICKETIQQIIVEIYCISKIGTENCNNTNKDMTDDTSKVVFLCFKT